jgi:hypothetical protein
MKRTATCACGQLQITCVGEPVMISQCHCLDCQKRTGSTYGVAAFFSREDVKAEGQSRTFRRDADSGFAVNFRFCPHCSSTVFWEPKPDAIGVAVGAFADPAFPAPTQAVYEKHRHAWVPSLFIE